jgi:hypothetical protein
MADLARNVELNMQANVDPVRSVEDILYAAVSNPKNWKVGDKFFNNHPQWREKFDVEDGVGTTGFII